MSSKTDKLLAESMGKRRPRETVREEVADSILGEMVPPTTIDVPLDALYVSPYQVREQADAEELSRLAESMVSAVGLISPIVIRPITHPQKDLQVKSLFGGTPAEPENLQVKSFELVTGHHRVQAAIKLGWNMIPAVIKHLTDAQAAIALTADNAIKKDLTDYDRYLSMRMLEETGACRTGRELSAVLGISTAQVSQLRAFGRLPAGAQDLVAASRGGLNYKAAYELHVSGLCESSPELVLVAIQRLLAGKIKAQNQLVQWCHQQLATRKPRTYRRELKIQRPGQQAIRLVVTEGGAVIDAKGLEPERLAKLIEDNLDQLLA